MDFMELKNLLAIPDDLTADDVMQEYDALEKERKRLTDVLVQQIDRLSGKISSINEEYEDKKRRMELLLMDYAERIKGRETKTMKKYRLPSGTLIIKKPRMSWKVDRRALLEFAQNYAPQYVKTTETMDVDWAELKSKAIVSEDRVEYPLDTGELVEITGASIEYTRKSLEVRSDGDESDTGADDSGDTSS